MSTRPAIEVHDLQKIYRDGWWKRRRVAALNGVSLDVKPGEIFGLLGPNGAGKTTLIKVLLGIVRKSGGQALLLGRPAGDRQARSQVGYLPESHRIPGHLTGQTALEYYGSLSGLSAAEIKRRRPALLETVGLSEWGRTSVRKYSKGMLQRLGLAQAMLHDPQLIILDEPTDGVDPVGRTEIRAVLKQLQAQGKTIFLNSHLLQEIELTCERVAVLTRGQVRQVAPVEEMTQAFEARAGAEAMLHLEGSEALVREALQGAQLVSLAPSGPQHVKATVTFPNQAALDELIDRLRSRGVSICSLARRRVTLEQAFLEIVKEAPTDL